MFDYITNSYRMGVDYRGISKTTLSFDEMLTYSTINNSATDNNLSYQLSNGTPVDLGLVFVGHDALRKSDYQFDHDSSYGNVKLQRVLVV